MKNLILATSLLISFSSATQAASQHYEKAVLQQNTVTRLEVIEVTDSYPQPQFNYTESNILGKMNKAGAILEAADVIVDKVISIGTKIWKVVEKGQAVYNFNNQSASALPKNAKSWTQLQNWSQPTSRVYSVIGYNIYGFEILHFDYRILLLYGGDVSGIGRYIGYASVQAARVQIPFLTDFGVEAKVESVYNTGTKANPVAGMLLTVNIAANSKIPLISKKSLGYSYALDGLGNITPM